MVDDLSQKSIDDIATSLRAFQLSAVDLLSNAEQQHNLYADTLYAYRVWDNHGAVRSAESADQSMSAGRAQSPLAGITVSVKDLFGVHGLETFAGSPNALPPLWEREGSVIQAVRKLGAVITGKTHMVEFAFGGLGVNNHWPTPRNPWDANEYRVAGGSSSGAGVSVIEGSAFIALGSDTAGSVRIPASVTGTVGFKPSIGYWPTDGMVPLSPSFDTPGLISRSMKDAATAIDAFDSLLNPESVRTRLAPADLMDIKIGRVDEHFWLDCQPDIIDQVECALRELSALGASITPSRLPGAEKAYALFRDGGLAAAEFKKFINEALPNWVPTLNPTVAARMRSGPGIDSLDFKRRQQTFIRLAREAHAVLADIDVIVSPTVPITAPAIKDLSSNDAYATANMRVLRNTSIANLLGLCALTIPIGLDACGIPVGLQLFAKAGDERRLIRIGLAIEGGLGTPRQRLGRAPMLV